MDEEVGLDAWSATDRLRSRRFQLSSAGMRLALGNADRRVASLLPLTALEAAEAADAARVAYARARRAFGFMMRPDIGERGQRRTR